MFKKLKKFTRKRVVPVKERALTNYNKLQRKFFVKLIIPYLISEKKGDLDIWYIDEVYFINHILIL